MGFSRTQAVAALEAHDFDLSRTLNSLLVDKQDSVPPIPLSKTPGVEDDVESVRQLSAMGFSRTQVVAALEAHDYDLQRTLISLMGLQ
jgi:NACalpha-BTF3-like transcription factor